MAIAMSTYLNVSVKDIYNSPNVTLDVDMVHFHLIQKFSASQDFNTLVNSNKLDQSHLDRTYLETYYGQKPSVNEE
jgi:hypothetical protein